MPDLPRDKLYRPEHWGKVNAMAEHLQRPTLTKHELEFIKSLPDNALILDFGCGNIACTKIIREEKPNSTINLFDADKPNLEKEFSLVSHSWKGDIVGTSYFQDFNGRSTSKHKRYDAIFSRHSLFFLREDDMQRVLKNLFLSMKSGGELYFNHLQPTEGKHPFGGMVHPVRLEKVLDMINRAGFHCERTLQQDEFYPIPKMTALTNYFFLRKP